MLPKDERARTKSPRRRNSQERRQPESDIPQGSDVWQAGEDYMTQRRQLLKVLHQARRELTETFALLKKSKELSQKF